MTHIDPDDLALIALADLTATPQEREHLAVCTECANDLLALQHTVDVGRAAPAVELVTPGPAAWGRIHSELGLSHAVFDLPTLTDFADAVPESALVTDESALSAAHSVPPPAPVVAISRMRRLWIPLAAATVLGLVAGYAVSSWLPISSDAPSVLARAELESLPGWNASGQASVEVTASGQRDVIVTLSSIDETSSDAPLREVWLLSEDATRLVSLGFLTGTTGNFGIPAEIDLAEFPLVDVSAEPNDGKPAHSADSIVRGELRSNS